MIKHCFKVVMTDDQALFQGCDDWWSSIVLRLWWLMIKHCFKVVNDEALFQESFDASKGHSILQGWTWLKS